MNFLDIFLSCLREAGESKPYTVDSSNAGYLKDYDSLSRELKVRILDRITKVESGTLGSHHDDGDGLWCLTSLGKGAVYRIYYQYGKSDHNLILLGCGTKSNGQNRDIKAAKSRMIK
jgi:putative addiction module killer protein